MTDEVFSIRAARARWSEIVARAERGERIVIARAGLPVGEIGPLQDIDRILYRDT